MTTETETYRPRQFCCVCLKTTVDYRTVQVAQGRRFHYCEQCVTNAAPSRVGDLYYTSWGYDQTNVEHFEVVADTGKSLVLRRIASEYRDGRTFPVAGAYMVDVHLAGNSGTPGYERDHARGYSEKRCILGRAGAESLRIDDVRHAWPCKGEGGSYSTDAAGLPGH